ncbi:MAG: ATP-binding protein [Spirochaetota bacterium]
MKKALYDYPVIILQGARQTGKTTLSQMPSIGKERAYLTLDDFSVLEKAEREPETLFIGHNKITLDEVQRCPKLLLAVKKEIDRYRTPGKFLITGSSNILLMKKTSESLAGRALYFFLPPLIWAEFEQSGFGRTIDLLFQSKTIADLLQQIGHTVPKAKRRLEKAVFKGGYPVPALSNDEEFCSRWLNGYIQTYLERDLKDISATDNLVDFRRLMAICAAQNGRVLNISSLALDAGISPATARRYLNLLEISFQVMRIPAYAVNRGKRLIKAPKIYWTDTGLAAHLAGIFSDKELVESKEWGAWLESWVAINLAVYESVKIPKIRISHFRTSNGQEVDFILERGRTVIPVEVKTTEYPKGKHIQGIETFLDTYAGSPFGILVCRCKTPHAVSRKIAAIPIETFLLN